MRKCDNKSKLTDFLVCLCALVRCVLSQSYDYQGGFLPSSWGHEGTGTGYSPHEEHLYMGHNGYGGTSSRFVEPIKAASYPLQYYGGQSLDSSYSLPPPSSPYHAPIAPPQPYYGMQTSQAQVKPTTTYSGYYYVQNKNPLPPNPHVQSKPVIPMPHATPFASKPYPPARFRFYQQRPRPVRPASSSYPFSNPSVAASAPVASPPLTHTSPDTYREAVDLFSEVVRKLEKDGGGNGLQTAPTKYLQNPLSNSIGGGGGGFPPHLDHIMGPEFIQRAERLYNKIIKEQNERLRQQKAPYGRPYFSRNIVLDGTGNRRGGDSEDDEILHFSESASVPVYQRPSLLPPSSELTQDTNFEGGMGESREENSSFKVAQTESSHGFAEHPLPFNEYEELVKDIAANHNY